MLLSLSSCLLCSTLQSISNPVFRLCDGLVAMWWVESSGKLVCILINSSFLVCKTLEVHQWQHWLLLVHCSTTWILDYGYNYCMIYIVSWIGPYWISYYLLILHTTWKNRAANVSLVYSSAKIFTIMNLKTCWRKHGIILLNGFLLFFCRKITLRDCRLILAAWSWPGWLQNIVMVKVKENSWRGIWTLVFVHRMPLHVKMSTLRQNGYYSCIWKWIYPRSHAARYSQFHDTN